LEHEASPAEGADLSGLLGHPGPPEPASQRRALRPVEDLPVGARSEGHQEDRGPDAGQPKPGQKVGKGEAMMKAAGFYSTWLPKLFMPETGHHFDAKHLNEVNRKHLSYAGKTSKLLARRLFATMAKYGPKLEKEQLILGNFVDIGVDLFVMATTLSYADHLLVQNPADESPQELADLFCREARRRIEANFRAVKSNNNRSYRKVAGLFMDGNLGREGITADLEAMSQAGIGGVILMEVDVGVPKGPVRFMSEPWRVLFKHAVTEAERLARIQKILAGPFYVTPEGDTIDPGYDVIKARELEKPDHASH
jgi:hypothetical protein